MADENKPPAGQELQFDRIVADVPSSIAPGTPVATCTGCGASIATEYYSVNGNAVCGRCRQTIEAAAQTPRGVGALVRAAVFGLGAGLIGAAIYYAVIALANLEVGIVAILIGYMVGYAVRKGAGDHGGRRFQVLGVVLMYGAVALAYTPLVFSAANKTETEQAASAETESGPPATGETLQSAAAVPPSAGQLIIGLAMALGFIAALPVLMVVGSMPSGLLSAVIIFFGMQQAWKMTGVPPLQVLGPFRVGGESASLSA